ncbi:hypothetical protein [Rhizohabitans arisaemae]|uniref:hypothetical protein n=1 Tax=Rhizohabitans arisaemae TaxID=2720610 RepID=UPI0024B24431|nr:hypothetical protein [Rhizohabitans arisaemae]
MRFGARLLRSRRLQTTFATSAVVMLVTGAGSLGAPAVNPSPAIPVVDRTNGVSNHHQVVYPASVAAENQPRLTVGHHVEFANVDGGAIERIDPDGTRTRLGTVRRAARHVLDADAGFWAAKYVTGVDGGRSTVVAASNYAWRIKAGPHRFWNGPADQYATYKPTFPASWSPKMFSIETVENYDIAARSRFAEDVVYTDVSGGEGIFGGPSMTAVGSTVKYFDQARSTWRPLWEHFETGGNGVVKDSDYYKPMPTRLLVTTYKPVTDAGTPDYIEFENWAAGDRVNGPKKQKDNGKVYIHYPGQAPKPVAEVLQRVRGSGRFGGTEATPVGGVTTNHPGALTLSTSPRNPRMVADGGDPTFSGAWQRGGIQIGPVNHHRVESLWIQPDNSTLGSNVLMIVGPLGSSRDALNDPSYTVNGKLRYDPAWEAVAPVFGMYIRPKWGATPAERTWFEVSEDFGVTWTAPQQMSGVTCPSDTPPDARAGCRVDADENPDHALNSPVERWTNIRIHLSY